MDSCGSNSWIYEKLAAGRTHHLIAPLARASAQITLVVCLNWTQVNFNTNSKSLNSVLNTNTAIIIVIIFGLTLFFLHACTDWTGYYEWLATMNLQAFFYVASSLLTFHSPRSCITSVHAFLRHPLAKISLTFDYDQTIVIFAFHCRKSDIHSLSVNKNHRWRQPVHS